MRFGFEIVEDLRVVVEPDGGNLQLPIGLLVCGVHSRWCLAKRVHTEMPGIGRAANCAILWANISR